SDSGGSSIRQPPTKGEHMSPRPPSGNMFSLDAARSYPVLSRGEGVYVWDASGQRYLDAIAGIAVMNLGYGRHEVVEAMARQANRLPFAAGNIFTNEPAQRL